MRWEQWRLVSDSWVVALEQFEISSWKRSSYTAPQILILTQYGVRSLLSTEPFLLPGAMSPVVQLAL